MLCWIGTFPLRLVHPLPTNVARRGGHGILPNFKFALAKRHPIDETRNQIVHWHEAMEIFDKSGTRFTRAKLIPPNYWDRSAETPRLGIGELNAFTQECDFISRSLDMFLLLLTGALQRSGSEQPWHDICRQPLTYPPPNNHPLSRSETES
jgi:hypothetical protein